MERREPTLIPDLDLSQDMLRLELHRAWTMSLLPRRCISYTRSPAWLGFRPRGWRTCVRCGRP
jgi:hypothetical protein